ncbi:hypothetical protein L7F22_021854 [Adiantum nelumboides]|nr:hypothetical protein [Adiantum nelumboides]
MLSEIRAEMYLEIKVDMQGFVKAEVKVMECVLHEKLDGILATFKSWKLEVEWYLSAKDALGKLDSNQPSMIEELITIKEQVQVIKEEEEKMSSWAEVIAKYACCTLAAIICIFYLNRLEEASSPPSSSSLVSGGGNAGHFAKLIPYLSEKYRVYAVDLLGFGASDKPESVNYGPELWAELLCDFAKEFAEEGAIMVGNAIGSLSALAAAAAGGADLFKGLVLLNCAGAMNRKGLMKENFSIRLLSPIFIVVEYLLQQPRVANFLFHRFRRKENIRKILEEQAYRNKASVTDQLVDILYEPSTESGATEVFVKVFTGDPGPRPEGLMDQISVPVLVLWGDSDIWTPPTGPVANFFKRLATERDNVAVFSLADVGHCPHDDRPELAAKYILPFISTIYE